MDRSYGEKRRRDESSVPWRNHPSERTNQSERRHGQSTGKSWARSDQARINHLHEEERHREYVAQEGEFILKQKRKAAEIRIKEGRPRPIDWLAVTLRVIDPITNPLDEEVEEADLDYVDPDSVFQDLSGSQLSELRRDIEEFIDLDRSAKNKEYWRTMRVICKDRQRKSKANGLEGRAVGSVASDIDRLLGPKSFEELEGLERQIEMKLDSDEPIDTDYWQQLLDNLLVYKAKARLKDVYSALLENRLSTLKKQSESEAKAVRKSWTYDFTDNSINAGNDIDPDPLLHMQGKDKGLEIIDEKGFLAKIVAERSRVIKMRYVPLPKGQGHKMIEHASAASVSQIGGQDAGDSQTATTLFNREAAKGVEEDEEVFAGEEEVETKHNDIWVGKYRPRKPKYFNRVQMGYEWNKYNQTHYDHDNPPPKVVQGYKFHIFYPDLIDNSKAPTYKIIREGGRKKGQTVAPAGEEDTCIIRFLSGPPYEDIAFRIVDRDWDYSAKHDRGFKSTFEKGILTLHFSFKKIYYRK